MSEINCVLLTVCSRTDEFGFKMLEKSLKTHNWPYQVYITKWKGFGTKIIATYEFLKSRPDVTHIFFCDAYDVVVLGSMEEALSKIQDKSKMVIGAERGLWPPDIQVYDSKFEHFDHGFNYVNSGLYFAPREVFMAYFEENVPEYSTDDQKWLTEVYLNQKNGNIVLDNNCDIFQNYSFLRDLDYNFDHYERRITNLNTDTYPIFFHGNGKTDMTPIYQLINANNMENPTESRKQCIDIASQKFELRRQALYTAENINRNQVIMESGVTQQVDVDKLLQDADKVYSWLTKEV